MCRYSESEINSQVLELRAELKKEGYHSVPHGGGAGDTHQMAEATQRKNQQLRAAFGISDDYVEGSAFDIGQQAAKAAQREKEREEAE